MPATNEPKRYVSSTARKSCPLELLPLLDNVMNRLVKGHRVEVCYVYFSKTFDLVDRDQLDHKMKTLRMTVGLKLG